MQPKVFDMDSKLLSKSLFKMTMYVLMTGAISCVVYMSGGVRFSYTHLMYIPIILTAYSFGLWQTILIAIFAGVLMGPLMPQDVETNLMQPLWTWIFRLLMFIVIGMISSLLRMHVKNLQKFEIKRLYTNGLTDYPNIKKFKFDMDTLIESKTPFSIMGFRIVNIENIKQNTSYDMGTKVLVKSLDLLLKHAQGQVYSIFANELAVILPKVNRTEAKAIGENYLSEIRSLLQIDNFKVGILINGAIIDYPTQIKVSSDAVKKIAVILDQTNSDFGLHEYDYELEMKSKVQSELVPDLLLALVNDEFELVYQPKISLKRNNGYEVEALIRWNHPTKGMIQPNVFISVAEDTGIINEITKLVVKKVINQGEKWKADGLLIKTSINISHKDFNNKNFVEYFMQSMSDYNVDPSLIGLEITERGVIDSTDSLVSLFNDLKKIGIKISIDDFGTGYNSLINLVKIPMDYLKIDKSFIDHINMRKYKLLIAQVIKFAHDMDIKVIAEGVETEEQFDILKELDCDFVQGYFISMPLKPEALVTFYKKSNKKK